MKYNLHCWHETGLPIVSTLMSEGNTITETVICCYCGARTTREWEQVYTLIPGHGPYARRGTRIMTVHDSYSADCPRHPFTVGPPDVKGAETQRTSTEGGA